MNTQRCTAVPHCRALFPLGTMFSPTIGETSTRLPHIVFGTDSARRNIDSGVRAYQYGVDIKTTATSGCNGGGAVYHIRMNSVVSAQTAVATRAR